MIRIIIELQENNPGIVDIKAYAKADQDVTTEERRLSNIYRLADEVIRKDYTVECSKKYGDKFTVILGSRKNPNVSEYKD